MPYADRMLSRAVHLIESKGLLEVDKSDNKVDLLCLTTLNQPSQCKHMLCGGSVWSKVILVVSEVRIEAIADPTYVGEHDCIAWLE